VYVQLGLKTGKAVGIKILGMKLKFVTYLMTAKELNRNLCLVIKFTVSWCSHIV
jgi:hypothetical protein